MQRKDERKINTIIKRAQSERRRKGGNNDKAETHERKEERDSRQKAFETPKHSHEDNAISWTKARLICHFLKDFKPFFHLQIVAWL